MRLGRQQDDVILAPVDAGGIVDDRYVERDLTVRIAQAQAITRQGLKMRSAGDQHHRVPMLMETTTGGTADRARTDHDVSHRPSTGRGPDFRQDSSRSAAESPFCVREDAERTTFSLTQTAPALTDTNEEQDMPRMRSR